MALKDGIIAYYKLNEASWGGAGTILDSGPGLLHANPASGTSDASGLISRGGKINSVAPTFLVPSNALFDTSYQSWQLWFKPDNSGDVVLSATLMNHKFHRINSVIHIADISGISASLRIGGSDYTITTGVISLPKSSWHHVVMTYDGSNIRLYVDNVAYGPTAIVGVLDAMSWEVDMMTPNGTCYPIYSDEFVVWNRAISALEVSQLYNSGAGLEINMASTDTLYYVGVDGDSGWNNANGWSLSSGDVGGAGVPTITNKVIFDANSPDCTLDIAASCADFDSTGFTNQIIHDGYDISVYGNAIISEGTSDLDGDFIMKGSGKTLARPIDMGMPAVIANIVIDNGSNIGLSTAIRFQDFTIINGGQFHTNNYWTYATGGISIDGDIYYGSSQVQFNGDFTIETAGQGYIKTGTGKWYAFSDDKIIDFKDEVVYNFTIESQAINLKSTSSNYFRVTNIFEIIGNTYNRKIYFKSGHKFRAAYIIMDGLGFLIWLYPAAEASSSWFLKVDDPLNSVSGVKVSYSDASDGETIHASDPSNVNVGNNINWNFNPIYTSSSDAIPEESTSFGSGLAAHAGSSDATPDNAETSGFGNKHGLYSSDSNASPFPARCFGYRLWPNKKGYGNCAPSSPQSAGVGINTPFITPFYSVGQNVTDHKTGSPTAYIKDSIIYFSISQTADNMGAGDKITLYDNSIVFLRYKLTDNTWVVGNHFGRPVADLANQVVNSIKHCFASLDTAIGSSGGVPYASGISNASFLGSTNLITMNARVYIFLYRDPQAPDVTPIVMAGFTTNPWLKFMVIAPGINTDPDVMYLDRASILSNKIQHPINAIPNTGWVMSVDSETAIYVEDEHIELYGLEVAGECNQGIWFKGVSTVPNNLNARIAYSIIHNTGNYGVRSTKTVGQLANFSIWSNIFYDQKTASVYAEGCARADAACNTIFKTNDTVVGIKVNAAVTFFGMEYTTILGNGGFSLDIINNCPNPMYFNFNRGETADFDPTSSFNRTCKRISTSYDAIFKDPDNRNFNLNDDSELKYAGVWDRDVYWFEFPEVRNPDMSGTNRYEPYISIGALEIRLNVIFNGTGIVRAYQDNLKYENLQYFLSLLDGSRYIRPASAIRNENDKLEFCRSSVIIMKLIPKFITIDKPVTILYRLTAYYDPFTSSLVMPKPNADMFRLLLKLCGDKQYIFMYDEQALILSIGIYPSFEHGLAGNKSVINSIKFGGSAVIA